MDQDSDPALNIIFCNRYGWLKLKFKSPGSQNYLINKTYHTPHLS